MPNSLSHLCKAAILGSLIFVRAMGKEHARGLLTLCACAALSAACASSGANQTTGTAFNASAVQAPSENIAVTLARAEEAYEAGDTAVLAKLVTALNASGVQPHTKRQTDQIALWKAASGVDEVPYRGRLLGPAYVRGELAPGETWRSAQTFMSGEVSTLSISHKGKGPVRMKVSDAKAREVCKPRLMKDPACRFTPVFTQRYDIELTNEGGEDAVYFLVFD